MRCRILTTRVLIHLNSKNKNQDYHDTCVVVLAVTPKERVGKRNNWMYWIHRWQYRQSPTAIGYGISMKYTNNNTNRQHHEALSYCHGSSNNNHNNHTTIREGRNSGVSKSSNSNRCTSTNINIMHPTN